MRLQQAKRALKAAVRTYQQGDLHSSADFAHAVLRSSALTEDSDDAAIVRAQAHEVLGVIHQDLGEVEAALLEYRAGEQALLGRPAHRAHLGRIQISLYMICVPLGLGDKAEHYAREAQFNVAGSEYEVYLANLTFWEKVDAQRDWRVQVQLCRDRKEALEASPVRAAAWGLRRLRRDGDLGEDAYVRFKVALDTKIAELQIQHGTDQEAEEGFVVLAVQALTFMEQMHDHRQFLSLTGGLSFLIDRPAIDLRDLLGQVVRSAFAAAQESGSAEMLGQAHFLAALLQLQSGDLHTAMGEVLTSLALGMNGLTRTGSALLRSEYKRLLDERRDLALTLCVRLGDAVTAAELIESERLQTLPQRGTRLDGQTEVTDVDLLLHSSRSDLGALDQVSVNGVSQLQGRGATHFPPSRQVVPLEWTIAAVGGDDAWWWGGFAALRRLHWVVRSPDGHLWCGTRTVDDEESALIESVGRDLTGADGPSALPWSSPTTERKIAADLASIAIPSVLRAQLLHVAETSLVVCGSWLSSLPLASLALDPAGDVRLIERAVIRIQPPAVLVTRAAVPGSPNGSKHPLLVSCTDPDGSLEHARHQYLAPLIELTHRSATDRRSGEATRANLIAALSRFPAGTPGIFFYSGHVASLDVQGGLNAVLVLQDEELLAAGDWLGVFDSGTRLPSPTRVVISACDSAGSGGPAVGSGWA